MDHGIFYNPPIIVDVSLRDDLFHSNLGVFLASKSIVPEFKTSNELSSVHYTNDDMVVWIVKDIQNIKFNGNDWIFEIGNVPRSSNQIFSLESLTTGNEATKLFKLIAREYLAHQVNHIKEKSFEVCEQIFSETLEFLASIIRPTNIAPLQEIVGRYINYSIDFLAEYENFFALKNEEEFIERINSFIKKHNVILDVKWTSGDDLRSLIYFHQSGHLILPIFGDERGDYLAVLPNSKKLENRDDVFYIFCLIDVVQRYVSSLSEYREIFSGNALLEQIFGLIPIPVSLVSSEGELLLHNQEFLKLNVLPSQCLIFVDGQEFEKENEVYKVHRVILNNDENPYHLFSFSSFEGGFKKREKAISSEQLGIISSSIAHELNNPIGGILAALSLIELEEWWDDDSLSTIHEMKKSAERLKKLVQIFLGFSKTIKHGDIVASSNFEAAFEQAINLIRFRMIESDIILEIEKISTNAKYIKEINPSVVTMIFYLILSEIITSISHHKLLSNDNSSLFQVKLYQYDDRIELEFTGGKDFAERINNSKLICQLVDIEGFGLYATGSKLIFQ